MVSGALPHILKGLGACLGQELEQDPTVFVVGLHLVSLDDGVKNVYEPVRVPYEDLMTALARAEALPWGRIAAAIPHPSMREGADHGAGDSDYYCSLCKGIRDQTSAAYLLPIGPVAGAQVSYGIPYDEGDTDSPSITPGLDVIHPNANYHEPSPIYGVKVAFAHVENGLPERIDLSKEAHQARRERLGKLADQANYYVVTHFD
jgi:hypothetical protein